MISTTVVSAEGTSLTLANVEKAVLSVQRIKLLGILRTIYFRKAMEAEIEKSVHKFYEQIIAQFDKAPTGLKGFYE